LALSKERKEELITEYTDLLERSRAVIFTEYRGLDNRTLTDVRRKVREANGAFQVTKLTLLKIALQNAGFPMPENLSGAPIAIGFCLDEIPSVAKALTEFAKNQEMFSVRGGLMFEQVLTAQQIESLADLPPLDVLRAQIIGLLDAPASNLVGVIQAGTAQIVNVLQAYVDQGEAA